MQHSVICLLGLLFMPGFSAFTQTAGKPFSDSSVARKDTSSRNKILKRIQVDTHGRALDTDGDGVPDYKDKELLTESQCFPVDSLGRGLCPEPLCCQVEHWNIRDPPFECRIGSVSIRFTNKSAVLNSIAKHLLDSLGAMMKDNPHCHLVAGTVSGLGKVNNELAWKRLNATIQYLVIKHGISEERLVFGYDMGDLDEVELRGINYNDPIPTPSRKKKVPY